MARVFSRTLQQTYEYTPAQRIVIDIPRVAFIRKIKILLSGTISNSGSSAVTLLYNVSKNAGLTP